MHACCFEIDVVVKVMDESSHDQDHLLEYAFFPTALLAKTLRELGI
jgi:hypothetical protein